MAFNAMAACGQNTGKRLQNWLSEYSRRTLVRVGISGSRCITPGEEMHTVKLNNTYNAPRRSKVLASALFREKPFGLLCPLLCSPSCLCIKIKCHDPRETLAGWVLEKPAISPSVTSQPYLQSFITVLIVLVCHHLLLSLPPPPNCRILERRDCVWYILGSPVSAQEPLNVFLDYSWVRILCWNMHNNWMLKHFEVRYLSRVIFTVRMIHIFVSK